MDIHEKILQLRKIVPENGATEAEAITALELANKLMSKYGVTEEELRGVEFKRDMKSGSYTDGIKQQDAASKLCSTTIAAFCEVQCWWEVRSSSTKFFGLNGDVEMAEFLMILISRSVKRSWKDFLIAGEFDRSVSHHKRYWSFHYGFGDRINKKLREMIDARQPKTGATGTDLVIMKSDLILRAMSEMLPNLDLRETSSRATKLNGSDYLRGQLAGDKVNLNRPIQEKAGTKFLE